MKLIAGSGRSGTTWVQDILCSANSLRPVFEPLHPAVSPIGARYAYSALLPAAEHRELQQFMADACSGRKHSMWIKYRGRPDRLFPKPRDVMNVGATRGLYHRWGKFLRDLPGLTRAARCSDALVKCIRANLMLDWLARWLDCTTVLIVRHPGAVIESQLRLGAVWDPAPALALYRRDPELQRKTDGRYTALLAKPLSTVEALAVNWVIENQWAVQHAAGCRATVVHYERLRSSPDEEWPRVCGALGFANAPDAAARARPSQQSSVGQDSLQAEPRWRRALSKSQIDSIQKILDECGFDLYSMYDANPRESSAARAGAAP